MKILTLILILVINNECLSHCASGVYKPPSRGKLPCGCNYYIQKKYVGRDCGKRPVYIYEKISSHKKCQRKIYRKHLSYHRQNNYYKYKK